MSLFSRFTSGVGVFSAGVDNTDRVRDNKFLQPVYAALLAFSPSASNTLIQPANLTGNTTITLAVGTTTTPPYIGDRVMVLVSSTVGSTITLGTGILASGSATWIIPATKSGSIGFMFNGTVWLETNRVLSI